MWLALWFAAIAAVLGALGGFGITSSFLGSPLAGASGSVGLLAAITGAAGGALVGFTAIFGKSIAVAPLRVLASIVGGFILALLITAFCIAAEPLSLKIRGYRRLSRRERDTIMNAQHSLRDHEEVREIEVLAAHRD